MRSIYAKSVKEACPVCYSCQLDNFQFCAVRQQRGKARRSRCRIAKINGSEVTTGVGSRHDSLETDMRTAAIVALSTT